MLDPVIAFENRDLADAAAVLLIATGDRTVVVVPANSPDAVPDDRVVKQGAPVAETVARLADALGAGAS